MHKPRSKYDPLSTFLRGQSLRQIDMTFDQIADLVGGLPASADKWPAWWANEATNGRHVQSKAWLQAGFHAVADQSSRRVRFNRVGGK